MLVDYDKALTVYNRLGANLQAPSLHPYYVVSDAKRDETLSPLFFVFEESENLFYYGFHLSTVPGTSFFDIQSPYGYGGPAATTTDRDFLNKAWQEFTMWCKSKNVLAEFVRFHPALENWQYFWGESIKDRETVLVNLEHEDVLSSYSTRARTAVRKALKNGLSIEWLKTPELIGVFGELYRQTMSELHADQFYFFDDQYMKALLEWDKAHLATCWLEGQVVGAAIFLQGTDLVEYHLSASNSTGKELGATNLMLHEAAVYGKNMGCNSLHLGGGTNNEENNPLLFFKSGFSKQRCLFKIGKMVHLSEEYIELKKVWESTHQRPANRVLFYR